MTKKDYTDTLLEDMNAKFNAVLELVAPLSGLPAKVDALQADVSEFKSDMKVVKAAVTDLSGQVNNHETRIAVLETA